MIGKEHQKSHGHSPFKDCKGFYPISVKHSIASTALSGSAGNSLMLPRDEPERRPEEPHCPLPLSRAVSSSTIVETAVRAFDQLARNNKKSHLLKKYA
jgi:hypothetical protein